jgi:L-iditol 2-dehydrogenase
MTSGGGVVEIFSTGRTMQAKRVCFTGPGKVEFESIDVEAPAENEVLIETLYTCISPGTERAHYLAEENTVTHDKPGRFYPGYSNIGRIAAVGPGVTQYRAGQTVATSIPHASHALFPVNPNVPMRKLASEFPAGRLFSPSKSIFPLPEGLSAERLKECATYCFSRVALHGVRRARLELGEAVLILGLGPIGLQCVQFAKMNGGFPVIAIDPAESRRDVARALGMDHGFANRAAFEQSGLFAPGGGPAVTIEATGLPEVIPEAFQLCGRNGRVILLGSTRGETRNVNFYTDVHKKGLTVIGVQAGTRPRHESLPGHWTAEDDQTLILKLIANGRIQCRPLITHEFPAARMAEAYELVRTDPKSIAVVLDWTNK